MTLGFCQNSNAQSKKQATYREYKSRSSSTSISKLMADAAAAKVNNPSLALDKVQEALAISVADGNSLNESKCYLLIGEINEQINEWGLARENYLRAHQILIDYSTQPEYVKVLKGLGKANLELNNFQESLTYFEQASNLSQGEEKAELQLSKSEVYYRMGNYEEAKNILDGIGIRKILNESFETLLQNQRAKVEARLNESIPSQNLYSNSLRKMRAGENVQPEAKQSLDETKEEISDVFREQQRYDDEISLRNNSIEFNLESNNLSGVAKDKVEIGKTLEAKGDTRAALKEIEAAAEIAETLDDPKEKTFALLALADMYEKNGRTNQALSAYKKYSLAVTEAEKQDEGKLLERAGLLKKQMDIDELTQSVSLGKQEDDLHEATVFRQQLIIYGLIVIILITAITSYFTYRSAQASKLANQLLALKSLRSQMNPHFIFNALNSVNHFIAQQDERTANKFLSEFSQLMRLVLENSEQDFITLNKEQQMLSLYIKLEHYRFRDKFDYEFEVDEGINGEIVELPPMLIQPYIENAVWHGLRYKESKGKLFVRFKKQGKEIEVEITDDGIGRKKSNELKTTNQRKHNSTGLKNISERLKIINKVYKSNYRVSVEDMNVEMGTQVKIHIPILANGK